MKYKEGQLLIWWDNTFTYIRKIVDDKIYVGDHLCSYSEKELDTLLDKGRNFINI